MKRLCSKKNITVKLTRCVFLFSLLIFKTGYAQIFDSSSLIEFDAYAPFFKLKKKTSFSIVQPSSSGKFSLKGQSCQEGMDVTWTRIGQSSVDACLFPKFRLETISGSTSFTSFTHPNQFVLLTHCDNQNLAYERKNLSSVREYLAYLWFDTLGIDVLKARLSRIQYFDTYFNDIEDEGVHFAVLLEDFEDMAKRKNLIVNKALSQSSNANYARTYDTRISDEKKNLLVFAQIWIGNWDWRLGNLNPTDYQKNIVIHNFLVLEDERNTTLSPYDFDLSSLVVGFETHNSKTWQATNEFDPKVWPVYPNDSIRTMMHYRLFRLWQRIGSDSFRQILDLILARYSHVETAISSTEELINEKLPVARKHLTALNDALKDLSTMTWLNQESRLLDENGDTVCESIDKFEPIKIIQKNQKSTKVSLMLKQNPQKSNCIYQKPNIPIVGYLPTQALSEMPNWVK